MNQSDHNQEPFPWLPATVFVFVVGVCVGIALVELVGPLNQ